MNSASGDPDAITANASLGEGDIRLRHAAARIEERLFMRTLPQVKIGRYALLEHLGEGGMGEVFAAYDDRLDRKVAIKIQHRRSGDDPRRDARLIREAQALAQLSHPNVIHVFEAGEVDGQLYIAMEFVRGVTLRAWLAERARPWPEILAMFVQAGRGLMAAPAAGTVHRDFKPDHGMVGEDGRARVLDFGLARADPNHA
jgi:serine/threonine protein kinase